MYRSVFSSVSISFKSAPSIFLDVFCIKKKAESRDGIKKYFIDLGCFNVSISEIDHSTYKKLFLFIFFSSTWIKTLSEFQNRPDHSRPHSIKSWSLYKVLRQSLITSFVAAIPVSKTALWLWYSWWVLKCFMHLLHILMLIIFQLELLVMSMGDIFFIILYTRLFFTFLRS